MGVCRPVVSTNVLLKFKFAECSLVARRNTLDRSAFIVYVNVNRDVGYRAIVRSNDVTTVALIRNGVSHSTSIKLHATTLRAVELLQIIDHKVNAGHVLTLMALIRRVVTDANGL